MSTTRECSHESKDTGKSISCGRVKVAYAQPRPGRHFAPAVPIEPAPAVYRTSPNSVGLLCFVIVCFFGGLGDCCNTTMRQPRSVVCV